MPAIFHFLVEGREIQTNLPATFDALILVDNGDLRRTGIASEITELKKQVRTALNFPEKLAIQRNLRTLEKKRDSAWREYDEAVRGIDKQKDALIDQTQARLKQNIEEQTLFTIRWKLI